MLLSKKWLKLSIPSDTPDNTCLAPVSEDNRKFPDKNSLNYFL